MSEQAKSIKEQRIRKITQFYYSRPDVQKAIFDFSKNREVCPRYFEGFGKRPDTFQYTGDIFELVKKGATSFHCSEELWRDPTQLETGMPEKKLNELRIGWDLLIDIDCKWFDSAKLAAQAIVKTLNQHRLQNIGVKFSGSKGFHILIPWKAFPKEVNGVPTSDLFPELPRKIISYIRFCSEPILKEILPEDYYKQFKSTSIKKGIKCTNCNEIADEYNFIDFHCPFCQIGESRKISKEKENKANCPMCNREFEITNKREFFECTRCAINSNSHPDKFTKTIDLDIFELMGLDLILVSPRHLFRMPYSLHEKTSFASVVIDANKIEEFEIKDASAMKVIVKDFMPECQEAEAKELVTQALDWSKEQELKKGDSQEKITGKYADFKPIKLTNVTEENFPPCIKKILFGVPDGRKRALFVLINIFRSIGMDKELIEKKITEWNKKNPIPLKEGYIKSQLSWTYQRKPLMPPNCKNFYRDLGVCSPEALCSKIKNPVNYLIIKSNPIEKKTKKK